MNAVSLRALSMSVCLWLGIVGIGAAAGMEQAALAGSEELPAEIEAWIDYVYAAERERSWSAYVTAAAGQHQQAAALQKFGMAGADTAEQLAALQQQAEERRLEQQAMMEAAYGAIAMHREWTVSSGEERSLAAVVADDAGLKDALQREEKAGRNAKAAELLRKAGTMNALQYLAAQDAYVQARLQASSARETHARAVIEAYRASGGQPVGLRELLAALEGSPEPSLIEGWMHAVRRYAASANGTISGSGAKAPIPAKIAGPDGILVPALPHASVALVGAPVALSAAAPPIVTASGQVYVPLRPYAAGMQYRIEWDAKHGLLRLTRGAEKLELRIGKADATVDGQPYATNGHTYVSLSWLSDATGSDIYWHGDLRQGIIITRAIGDVE